MKIEQQSYIECDLKEKNREEIKNLIQGYLKELYGVEGEVELTINEINRLDNVLKDICKQHTPKTQMPMKTETKKKISDSRRGFVLSEEHKERIRQNSQRINVYQFDKETGELIRVWKSTREAGRYGYCSSLISKVCRGVKPSAYNCIWRYKPIGEDDTMISITVKKTINGKELETTLLQKSLIN